MTGFPTINTFSMITFNISLSKELADIVETEVKDKKFANRSEFFRHILRAYYFDHQKKLPPKGDLDYYKMADYSMKDWLDDENEDIFLIK